MGKSNYIFIIALIIISAPSVILCLLRSRGIPRKKLLCFAFLLGITAMICFGGKAILACFDMGWRCTPFNIMLFLCAILFIITLWRCLNVLSLLENTKPVLIGFGFISLVLVMIITLAWTAIYFHFLSWHDGLTTYNNQMIVYANDQHGGSCSWRYYSHVNSLVHGIEITQDGWWGYPPFKS